MTKYVNYVYVYVLQIYLDVLYTIVMCSHILYPMSLQPKTICFTVVVDEGSFILKCPKRMLFRKRCWSCSFDFLKTSSMAKKSLITV